MLESIFFQPWVWIIPVILIVLIVLIWLDLAIWDTIGLTIIAGVFFVLGALVYFSMLLPPYDVAYYQTYRITGEISEIQSAFSGEEGTMSQTFVAKVDGIPELIQSSDQRFRTLEVGDDVNLVCGLQFAYFQEPWFDCSFGGVR